ncbi:MAG: hypothetical protein KDA37_11960, partial [Planctomycetales bacterium]|nr:hypothetical protein [Planctomycetales bacterium]
ITPQIQLSAVESDQVVEQWRLMVSPVWSPEVTGLAPVFAERSQQLEPVWRPWPGEQATVAFSRPEAARGDTTTIHRVNQLTSLGARLRTSELDLDFESSLAGDFGIKLPRGAEVTAVQLNNSAIPVRRDGDSVVIPARPGRQQVKVAWKLPARLQAVSSTDEVSLPTESANVTTVLGPPADRWVLWAEGPTRGPAVRFWAILVVAVLVGLALGQIPNSPLGRVEWVLLAIGLTQVHMAAAVLVVGWLIALAWRGRMDVESINAAAFNALQCVQVLLTLAALTVLLVVVREGLLGDPVMFIVGNGSSPSHLEWLAPRSGPTLPRPLIVSVSVWWYRLLMLLWALWLASALVRWLRTGWQHFTRGAAWRHGRRHQPSSPEGHA